MISMMMFWQYRISILFLLLFLVIFLPLRYSKWVTFLCLTGCFVITGVMDYLYLIVGKKHEISVFFTLGEIIVVQTAPFLIAKYRDFRAMFVGFTAAGYVLAGNIVGSILYIAGVDFLIDLACESIIHLLILGILIWKIRESFLISMENTEVQWGKLCLIPALFYTATYAISTWPANIYKQPENLLGVCCIMALMVSSYIMIIGMFSKQKQDEEMKRSMEYLENYAEQLKREADVLREKETETAVIRHDLRHYSILINSYLEDGRTEEIRELLRVLNEHGEDSKSVRYCENLAVNGIVTHCAKQANQNSIRFDVDIEIPQKMRVNEFEFATVVSNLLENAVQAAALVENKQERFVKITAHGIKDKLILEVINGCSGKPEISKSTGLPVSQGGRRHGYGMKSVRAFANKNDAVFSFTADEKNFSVKMLLKII
ncbi:MAG: ATP-binding protein [Eubacteriales bacterium]|nr:ATP-binding protein [Eubacteriales bacterium]